MAEGFLQQDAELEVGEALSAVSASKTRPRSADWLAESGAAAIRALLNP